MIRTLAFASAAALLVSAATPALAQYRPPVSRPLPSDEFGGPRTQHFVTAAAQSDEFERRAGHMAERMGVAPRVRDFGAMMVRDHTQTTQDLQAAIRRTGHTVAPPPPLTDEQQRMLERLRSSGGDFDHIYLRQQVRAHQDALNLLQDYARNGHNPVLQDAARQTIPLVQRHLNMAMRLEDRVRR